MNDRTIVQGPLLSVWGAGQQDSTAQFRGSGYVLGTEADVDQVPPAVAAHAISVYTRPGELVVDPDCGAGSVPTEALRAGRHALGLTTRSRWWSLARANITAAKKRGAWPDGSVLDAQPKTLATVRAAGLIGQVGLVLTALRPTATSDRPESVGALDAALIGLAKTLNYCQPLLRPGGHVVVVARPRRRPDGSLADLITPLTAAGASAGLIPVERCLALTGELRGERLISHASLAERRAAVRSRTAGTPSALIVHREVLVFQFAYDAELAAAGTQRTFVVKAARPTRRAA